MLHYTLARNGNFYKGNLHTHTTVSDGQLSPEDTIRRFQKNNYSFLSITDHNIYSVYSEWNAKDFLMIPGVELDTTAVPKGVWGHHIVGIGHPDSTCFSHGEKFVDEKSHKNKSAQEIIDFLVENKHLAIYAHPYWSRVDISDIKNLKNLAGMEIMNYGCEVAWKCGNSEVFFDHFLWNNNFLWCLSTDDCHGHINDYCGGYIVVKTDDFSHSGILEAIEKGSFYASYAREGEEAPEIIDFVVEDGIAKITCGPCRDVYIYTPRGHKPFHGTVDSPITYAEYKINTDSEYVRVTCVDFNGNTSWCQPISLR